MAGGHEGVYEDGVLATCGICGCRVHMLDPEEMDWICDPCSTEGWAGTISAWKLRPGHVVSLMGNRHVVVGVDLVGKWAEVETLKDGEETKGLRFMRATRRVYVHEKGAPIT